MRGNSEGRIGPPSRTPTVAADGGAGPESRRLTAVVHFSAATLFLARGPTAKRWSGRARARSRAWESAAPWAVARPMPAPGGPDPRAALASPEGGSLCSARQDGGGSPTERMPGSRIDRRLHPPRLSAAARAGPRAPPGPPSTSSRDESANVARPRTRQPRRRDSCPAGLTILRCSRDRGMRRRRLSSSTVVSFGPPHSASPGFGAGALPLGAGPSLLGHPPPIFPSHFNRGAHRINPSIQPLG